ncbi:MAG: type II secretion system protein GspM [Gammaproteobacteria bacterium]
MNDWWQGLQPRERLMVGGLGVFMFVFLFYFLLLEDLLAGAKDYRAKSERAKSELAWMQQAVQQLPTGGARQRNSIDTTSSLNVIVDRTRTRYRLTATNTQQVGASQLRVRLEDAKFDDIVRWLGDLRTNYGITIETATVNQTDVRGTTTASLTLSRPQS